MRNFAAVAEFLLSRVWQTNCGLPLRGVPGFVGDKMSSSCGPFSKTAASARSSSAVRNRVKTFVSRIDIATDRPMGVYIARPTLSKTVPKCMSISAPWNGTLSQMMSFIGELTRISGKPISLVPPFTTRTWGMTMNAYGCSVSWMCRPASRTCGLTALNRMPPICGNSWSITLNWNGPSEGLSWSASWISRMIEIGRR